ncbi:MAG: Gfo/Idh/MocA family protein [Verrucomicrobiales bacterium]
MDPFSAPTDGLPGNEVTPAASSTASRSRRAFLLATATAAISARGLHAQDSSANRRQIKIGLIGAGGRGSWIANLFKEHGGYEFHAVADYFQPVAEKAGASLGVDKARCFSGLSGFRKVIESGVEAVLLETPPYFFPEHAAAAVAAGLHVFMAKPVAVDVPGCLAIEAAAAEATKQKKVFLVDYQIPTDPMNIEVVKRVRDPAFGPLQHVQSTGICGGFADPPRGPNLESRLTGLVWVNDIALGCDYIGNFDIHAIDAALWLIGERPIKAYGNSRIGRPNPNGDAHDVCSVVFSYANGVVHNHFGQGLANATPGAIKAVAYGSKNLAQVDYYKEAYLHGDGPLRFKGGPVDNLYKNGAVRNIATFYQQVTDGGFSNETVRRSVDGCLTCILGREAAARNITLTMEKLLRENRKLEVDLTELKA